ncbi:hypothetical protein W911_02910 [Hyphomicrobium nitrativorans NL23]|uniref:Uncharacterized protein n=1 Tax=Hyphomicrobium nitrativorans NL23 TaxID=1029756 RepID=V5SH68_9HYPH|nr:hypothetical protein W911_02910 [Hyphomicrobium nitrativorans NL23]
MTKLLGFPMNDQLRFAGLAEKFIYRDKMMRKEMAISS